MNFKTSALCSYIKAAMYKTRGAMKNAEAMKKM